MIRVFVWAAFAVLLTPSVTLCQQQARLHRIDTKNANGLRELLRHDGATMPLVSAHRGGAVANYPENCIATFEHTLQSGFSILEIDLQYTKDRQIVLHHDRTLDRTTSGTGPVSDRSLQQLQHLRLKDNAGNVTKYLMPTLDETLRWARGKTILILDKKNVQVEDCVKKIQEHQAHGYAMIMAYNFEDIRTCHRLDPDIMMEVMIGNSQRLRGFRESGVPWDRIVAFVGHDVPRDADLLRRLHANGVCCMAGTSRNLDRQLRNANEQECTMLRAEYQSRLDFGIDLIETDLPVALSALIYDLQDIPESKARFFFLPTNGQTSASQ
ncbi:putative glycerophosphoryl diester phosphodiesterase 1 [Planctomycetes bacterium CA13]|uniref:Putative glycerophosphoryl diester phosphodiesterase 1 n=1 Tax=Novipirellula herctigrandis TaxID=2527986 RepID=A0A5C5ZA01_9BACT|nr:putative glycerophosphoryl diester phosphodiesterase 1 [Planctomycetes bacterium CA13]